MSTDLNDSAINLEVSKNDSLPVSLENLQELVGSRLTTELPSAAWTFMSSLGMIPMLKLFGNSFKFPFNDDACSLIIRKCSLVQARNMRVNELSANQFSIKTALWKTCFDSSITSPLLENIRKEMAPGCVKITAKLNKMYILDRGCHFKTNGSNSTPTAGSATKHHFASLMVVLPSEHTGGDLVVSHLGTERKFTLSCSSSTLKSEPLKCHAIAFFRACQHELTPVTSGHMITLVYDLFHDGGIAPLLPLSTLTFEKELGDSVEKYFMANSSSKLGYLLQHHYPQLASPNPDLLLKEDRVIYDALINSRPIDVELATVHVHVTCSSPQKADFSIENFEVSRIKRNVLEALELRETLSQQYSFTRQLEVRRGSELLARGNFDSDGLLSSSQSAITFINNWEEKVRQEYNRKQTLRNGSEIEFICLALIFNYNPESNSSPAANGNCKVDNNFKIYYFIFVDETMGSSELNSTISGADFGKVVTLGERKLKGTRISILEGDLSTLTVDALVLSTDDHFNVSGSFGETLMRMTEGEYAKEIEALLERHNKLNCEDALLTFSCVPNFKFIIHSNTEGSMNLADLEQVVTNALVEADKVDARSIVFPCFEIDEIDTRACARTVLSSINDYLVKHSGDTSLSRISVMPLAMNSVGAYLCELAAM